MRAVILDGIVLGLAFGLLGVGMTLVYGLGGVINLAYGQIVVLGAIVTSLVMNEGVSTALAAVVGVLAAAGVAVLLDLTLMRPVYREQGEERILLGLLLTLGAAFVIGGLLTWRYPPGARPHGHLRAERRVGRDRGDHVLDERAADSQRGLRAHHLRAHRHGRGRSRQRRGSVPRGCAPRGREHRERPVHRAIYYERDSPRRRRPHNSHPATRAARAVRANGEDDDLAASRRGRVRQRRPRRRARPAR